VQTNNINQGNSVVKQLGAGYTYSHQHWQYTFSLSEQIERYNFFSGPYQTSHLFLPSFGLQHLSGNDPLAPTDGNRFNASIKVAKQGILSDTSMVQTTVSDKWIHSFNSRNMILLRGNLGLTAIHDINLLPLSLNFFTGGSQSVRGYGYNNLGPGRYLVVSSVEYRYRVYKKWYATTFFDIGNAFNNWPTAPHSGIQSNLGALNHRLNQGAGVGVLWSSPLGAMELTYAKEVNVSGMPGRIQFNLGTDL
jgi:translocation and assembly module TamA